MACLIAGLIATVTAAGTDPAGNREARDLDWWSLRPVVRPALPELRAASLRARERNPVDRFVFARLEALGIEPSAEADRRTLIRRLSFDLVGLPPTLEAVRDFETDPRPDAYERLVDRLLDSPHYGERWARHWLDVARYGETHGYDKDKPRLHAWPYRDYVIRAFNRDLPYGEFVRQQVAGDVLAPGTEDGYVALGFVAAGPWDFIGHEEVPETKTDGKIARLLDRDDMVANVMNAFCSLTLQCARCHNHKFDPVSMEDYYRTTAVFAALDRADRRFDLDPAVAAKRADLEARRKPLAERKSALEKSLPPAPKDGTPAPPPPAELAAITAELEGLARQLKELPAPRVSYAALVHQGSGNFRGTGPDGGRPRPITLLARGDVTRPRGEVQPGVPPLVPGEPAEFQLPAEHREGDRRVALARWLTHPQHPLVWRSIVNRVWMHHFGRGLSDTPNDFGRMGEPPTHPELLDWLAATFRDEGQSLKALHRLLVTSATYRQSSATHAQGVAADADNRFLWRMNRRKLEAEAVRDAALAVSGALDARMGGPSFQDFVIERPEHSPHYEYHLHDPAKRDSHRRSIYRFLVRSHPQPFMAALDCADPSMSVDKRNQTLTPLQALALLNNPFMVTMAEMFAAQVEQSGTTRPSKSGRPANTMSAALPPEAAAWQAPVQRAFERALARSPTAAELSMLSRHAATYGLPSACRIMFNLTEFTFAD